MTASPPLRILLVEDSPSDAKLVIGELRRAGLVIEFERVETGPAMRASLEGASWDVVISDWSMPSFSAPAALALLKETGLDLPFIIVSGTVGEEHAVTAMRAGAHDYVLKDKLGRLAPAVEREVREHQAREALRAAERARRTAELRFRKLFDAGIIGIMVASPSGAVIEANDTLLRTVGYTQADLRAGAVNWQDMTPPEWRHLNVAASAEMRDHGRAVQFEKEYIRKDGTRVPVLVGVTRVDEEHVLSIVTDLTAQKRAEAALRASEARFRRLEESGIIGIGVGDIFGKVLAANDASLNMLGYSREEFLALSWHAHTPPEWLHTHGLAASELKAHGGAPPWEQELLRKDGSRVPVLLGVAMLEFPECMIFVADLTRQKRAEASLMDRMRAATLTAAVSTALTGEGALETTLERCCQAVVETLEAPLVRIWTLDAKTQALAVRASAGPLLATASTPFGYPPTRIVERARPYITDDLQAELEDGPRARARYRGINSFAGHPLIVGKEIVGVMDVFTRGPLTEIAHRAVASIADGIAVRIRGALADQARSVLEGQLRQSQKMDAIGRLAGGVAHDFNNLLSVVLGYSDMLMVDLKRGDPVRDDIEEIHRAGTRAADLTRQLLMFSRQQVIAPRMLHLGEVLANMDKMLRRIVGEDVELTCIGSPSLGRVHADPGSIDQVIMNLVINARDAMPTGGKITMETANVALDEHYVQTHIGAKVGRYVMLSVTDTGTGMDRATVDRIFEPFFTSKPMGKGTGLGLSTVLGIVQQSGGSIWVYSEPGLGSTFKVYLPAADARSVAPAASAGTTTGRGHECILLVEDEPQVRDMASGILRRHGYTVLVARDADDALVICERHPDPIDLLLSDVVMPRMSGPELAKRIVRDRPQIKVLCMSGYTDDAAIRHGVLDAELAYLQKPLTVATLTTKVREVLDAKP